MHQDYLLERVFTTSNINLCGNQSEKNEAITVKDVYGYVKSLKESVEIWFQILNPEASDFDEDIKTWLEKLNRLEILPYAPLIMVFFKTTNNASLRIKLLKSLEKYIFLTYLIRSATSYSYYMNLENMDFIEMSLQLSDSSITPENIIKRIDQEFDSLKNSAELISNVKQEFHKKGFYKWSGVRYFLYEYELDLKEQSKTYRNKIKWGDYVEDCRDYHTVEHVYPQRPKKTCWISKYDQYSSVERTALRHSLGNLVPLSQPKNSSFQNKCFEDKKNGVGTCIGFIYGSYSENEIAQHEDWTAKEILMRGLKLLAFMERRWKLNFGSIEDKLYCLHVDFVLKKEGMSLKGLEGKTKRV